MNLLSVITLGSSVGEMILNLILAGVLWLVGHYCYQLVIKIGAVHDYMIKATEITNHMEHEIKRIDNDVKQLESDISDQIKQLDQKFDRMIAELKRTA